MGRLAIKLALAAALAGLASGCTTVPIGVGSIPNAPRATYVSPGTSSYVPTAVALPTTDDVADVPPGYVSFLHPLCRSMPGDAERAQLDPADRRGMADHREGQCEYQRSDLARRRSDPLWARGILEHPDRWVWRLRGLRPHKAESPHRRRISPASSAYRRGRYAA